jgi:HEAT repeat protein
MPKRKVARIAFVKAAAGVSFRTLRTLEDGQPHIIDALLSLLSDISWQVRSASVEALARLYEKQTESVNIQAAFVYEAIAY